MSLSLWNGLTQVFLFLFVVCIPAYYTKRMSYVDIAWPWGLVLISFLVLIHGKGYWLRTYCVAGMYFFSGLRMGIGALILFKKGHLDSELPRYQFQRKRWKKLEYKNENISLQYEILIQCFANTTFLALPAIIQSYNTQENISLLEISGYIMWGFFFIMENIADFQKNRFLKKCFLKKIKKQVCNIGLWKYCRHPNYFSEWMIWNALIISSLPSFFYLLPYEKSVLWIGLLISLIYISRVMYNSLVYYTGAIPSEYYSLKKRPGYKKYQETTNMFFPGKSKKIIGKLK